MKAKERLDLNVKKQGLLMPNRSIYGRWMAGYFTIPTAAVVTLMLSIVPWDVFYRLNWYQGYLSFIAIFSRNISEITNTGNPFPEYSIAFLGFINTVGPLYAAVGLYFGLKHTDSIGNVMPARLVSSAKLAGLALGLAIAIIILLWGAYCFSAESAMFSDRFYKTELRFVAFFTLLWFAISMFCYGMAAIASIIFSRFRVG